jgi:hypothetical protein
MGTSSKQVMAGLLLFLGRPLVAVTCSTASATGFILGVISIAIISFLCTAFLGICLGAYFVYVVEYQNIITDFAHNIHKIITCKNNEYI